MLSTLRSLFPKRPQTSKMDSAPKPLPAPRKQPTNDAKRHFKRSGNHRANTISIAEPYKAVGTSEIKFYQQAANNTIRVGKNFFANNLQIQFKGNNNTLIIGDDVRWVGTILIVGNGRTVTIGDRSTAVGVYLLAREQDITIGEDCMLSREIEIRSSDVHKIYDLSTNERINPSQPVVVGNKVWIGARAFVSKGSRIPDGSIIGAASFVNKSFEEPNTIIAGTPASVVKRHIRWER